MDTNTNPWFALQVKYHHEKMVALALRSKGYNEFLPLFRSRHRTGGRVQYVDLPLFPTYVFCQFDPLKRLPILMTPGVFSIVGTDRSPLPVNEQELSAVRAMVNSTLHYEPSPYLHVGNRAFVEEGPLRGAEGILQRVKNQDRLVISMTILQRSVAVEIDRSCLRLSPANSAQASELSDRQQL